MEIPTGPVGKLTQSTTEVSANNRGAKLGTEYNHC